MDARVTLDPSKEQVTFTVDRPLAAGVAEIEIKYPGSSTISCAACISARQQSPLRGDTTGGHRRPADVSVVRRARVQGDVQPLAATIDNGDHAISNGAVISDTPGPGSGKHTVKFETTPKMSTYLVALAVGDFECQSGSADGIPIRICSTPDKKGQTGFALEAAEEILRYYNSTTR